MPTFFQVMGKMCVFFMPHSVLYTVRHKNTFFIFMSVCDLVTGPSYKGEAERGGRSRGSEEEAWVGRASQSRKG